MGYGWIINPFVVHCKSEICLVWVDFKSDTFNALSCRIGTLEIFIFIITKSYISVLWVCSNQPVYILNLTVLWVSYQINLML